MTNDGFIYNYKGDKYWQVLFNNESGKLNLYEGRHGNYVGVIVKNINDSKLVEEIDIYSSFDEFKREFDSNEDKVSIEIFDFNNGKYIGEIKDGRLIVDELKEKEHTMKKNMFYKPFGKIGSFKPKENSLEIPKGYHDFKVGWD